jgi:hypothetical protein
VAAPPAIGCAQDTPAQAKKPKQIAAINRSRPALEKKFKRFSPFTHLTDLQRVKHITPFSSTFFDGTMYNIAKCNTRPHYLFDGTANG